MNPAVLMYFKKIQEQKGLLERRVNWDYSSGFTVFLGQAGENVHKKFIMSKDFPVQKMNFTTWEMKGWKYKAINHKLQFKAIFSIYRVLIPPALLLKGKAILHSANSDAEKIAFLVPLKQVSFVFTHSCNFTEFFNCHQ